MALIKRINVREFKVVSFFSEPGPQELLSGNIWNLTNETSPNITEDFNGVARTSVLLAYLEETVLNIPNMYYGEFTNLPPNPHENINPVTGTPFLQDYELYQKDIGWVRINDSVASIYYEYCEPMFLRDVEGRLPVSKNYFSHDTYGYGTIWEYPNPSQGLYRTYKDTWEIVDGNILPGNNNFALRVIDTYDFYSIPPGMTVIPGTNFDAISFGPNPLNYPFGRFEGYDPVQYFQLIITPDGLSRIEGPNGFQDVATIKTNDIRQVDLLYNTRSDIVTPGARGYTGIDSDISESGIPYDDGKKLRWGYSRTIIQGFAAEIKGPTLGAFGNLNMWEVGENNRTVGNCINFSTGDGNDDISEDPGVYPRIVPDKGTPPTNPPFCDGCPPASEIPIKTIPLDGPSIQSKNIVPYIPPEQDDNIQILRSFYQTMKVEENIRDPREFYNETENYPKGYTQILFNKKDCEFHILPALRDKDGDIPEPIGQVLQDYFEDIRSQITSRFYLRKDDNVLKELSYGKDGYPSYSDGKSYKELLGESLFGCGEYYSFDMIPEVFVEIYNPNESIDVRNYREKIERSSWIPWPLPKPDRSHDRNFIIDVVRDITTGIPDADYTDSRMWLGKPGFENILAYEVQTGVGKSYIPINLILPEQINSQTPGEHLWSPGNKKVYVTNPDNIISRWKSTIRPIYHKIYENKDELEDPRFSTRISFNWLLAWSWITIPIVTPTPNGVIVTYETKYVVFKVDFPSAVSRYLGDIKTLPWRNETWRDPNTLGDYEFRSQIPPINGTYGYGEIIYDKLDKAISNRIHYEQFQKFENETIPKYFSILVPGLSRIKYILNVTDTIGKTWRRENIVSLYRTFKFIKSIFDDAQTQLYSFFDTDVQALIVYTITSIYESIKSEYERENLDRGVLQPARMFKKGGVILKSRSGNYFHDKEPCPIIFLGFNDRMIIHSDLKNLSKKDIEEEMYYRQDLRHYSNKSRNRIRLPRVVSKYIMKRRVKQYGINPLLDIFYLNIAEKSAEHPARSAFRIGPEKTLQVEGSIRGKLTKKDWPNFSKGQYPYMFPPLWNEPANIPVFTNLSSDPLWSYGFISSLKESLNLQNEASFGDLAWENRVKNTILSLEDRWSMSLEGSDDDSYVVLTDKTPILDIYNQLMEMHVKGVNWDDILKYVSYVRTALGGSKYSEKIDLSLLETINLHLNAKLYKIDGESSRYENKYLKSLIQPISWGIVDFGENDPNSSSLLTNVVFETPDSQMYIDQMFVDTPDVKRTDVYGNSLSDLFEIDFTQYRNSLSTVLDSSYLEKKKPLLPNTFYSFSIRFKNNLAGTNPPETYMRSVEPMFGYSANLIIRGTLDGKDFESKTGLVATVSTDKKITITDNSYYRNPLNLPTKIFMGFAPEELYNSITQKIVIGNHTDSDVIKITSVKIQSISAYKKDGTKLKLLYPTYDNDGKLTENTGNIEIFYTDFSNSSLKNIELQPTPSENSPSLFSFNIGFNPYKFNNAELLIGDDIFYTGIIQIDYERKNLLKNMIIRGRSTADIPWVKNTSKIEITGYTKKQ